MATWKASFVAAVVWAAVALFAASTGLCAHEAPQPIALRGRVVWLGEALKAVGVEIDPDAAQSLVVLQTDGPGGEFHPLVKDARGRGFWLDERLRGIDLELLVSKAPGSPLAQVIRVYRVLPEGRFELDYWCDICAIPMFERKPCECCQGETRLRLRKVDEKGESPSEEIPFR